VIWLWDLQFIDDFDLFRDEHCLFVIKLFLVLASTTIESWLRHCCAQKVEEDRAGTMKVAGSSEQQGYETLRDRRVTVDAPLLPSPYHS
jgi:hypothetical protein